MLPRTATDLSADDTTANEDSTWTFQNSPELQDSAGNLIGSQDPTLVPPADAFGYQDLDGAASDGYTPYMAADGTDLSTVPAAGGWSSQCRVAQETGSLIHYGFTVWTRDRYTVVGEYHANWDTASAQIMYENGATSSVALVASADDKHFHVEGHDTLSDGQTGSGGGFNDPDQYNAGKLYVLIKYVKTGNKWFIPKGPYAGGPPPAGSTICRRRYVIEENGIVPSGDGVNNLTWTSPTSQASHSWWLRFDGYIGYENNLPKSKHYLVPWQCGGLYYAKNGQGYDYSWAVTIGGIGIQAETDHSSDTFQQISFGCATRTDLLRHGVTDGVHWLWGSNEPAGNPYHPKIFYDY